MVNIEKKAVVDFLEDYRTRMIEISEAIWGFAEIGLEEKRSSALLKDMLKTEGFDVETGVAGMPTAFTATCGKGQPVIGIIAEYDALPGLSNHPVPYRNPVVEGEPGHGCGHNLFGTASAAAGIALKRAMEKFKLQGTVKVFGTPAEEVCIGKPYMAKAGYFEGIDAFLDWHPDAITTALYSTCNAYSSVRFVFHGTSAHGNSPWLGRSALEAAELMGVAVNYMRGHMDPGNPPMGASTINYTFLECGKYPNVVPDRAEAWYVYRIPTRQALEEVHERVLKCARGAALATETSVDVRILTGTHELIPNEHLARLFQKNLEIVGPPQFDPEEEKFALGLQDAYGKEPLGLSDALIPPAGGSKGVTDSSEPSWFAPYAVLRVACKPLGIPGHSWGACAAHGMSIGQKGMMVAAKALGLTGLDILMNPDLLEPMRNEFTKRLAGRTYESAVPEGQEPPLPEESENHRPPA